ncbi:MAG TPA: DUF3450 family protein [Opitutaceae bacterium]|jgi:hypothetical protein|nr:DUF3450 family protein [Opitutaceae bacterium]
MNVIPHRRTRWLILPGIALALIARAAPSDNDPMQPGEKAAGEWIKVRLETARLETEWLSDKPLLESTVLGLKDRAQTLEEKRALLLSQTAKDREEIATMQGKNKDAAEDLHAAESRLQALDAKLTGLRPFLPPRLSDALELSYRSIGNTGLAMGERMQLSMTMLNRCLQFNRTVTSGEEVLSVDGENTAKSLEVIYWGLSHGYALDRKAGKAWYGSPGPQGWRWQPLSGASEQISRLLAVYNDKADPDFIAVPATLSSSATDAAK